MLKEIAPFYAPTNTCVENLYVSICNALHRNVANMYAYSWNFGYNALNHEELFGQRITPGRDGQEFNSEQIYALEKYCGITPIWHINCEHSNFINIVKREIDNDRPVVLGLDIFDCYWHKAANKYHFAHYCLVVGIDEDGFICIDDTLASTDGNLILSSLPMNVTLGFDTFSIDLVRGFSYFIWGRYNYIAFLNSKKKYKGGEILAISRRIDESMNLWGKIRHNIVKYAIEPSAGFEKDLVCNRLSEIIKIEEPLANEIVQAF